jgi:hypothetical protein
MKILTETKRIVSKAGVLHFTRFAIIETRLFSIYLHKVYKEDEDKHMHNHPWTWCRAFRISGRYMELFASKADPKPKLRVGGRNSMRPDDYHKIHAVLDKPVVSIFLTGRRLDSWGYLVQNPLDADAKHVDHKKYRELKRAAVKPVETSDLPFKKDYFF